MTQKALIIDVTRCTACFVCHMACKDEFAGQAWPPYNEAQPDTGQQWISVEEIERGQFPHVKSTFVPQPCMLCQDPLCVKAAKDGGAYVRDDGIVIFDPKKSRGQRGIATACRYGRAFWNEELGIPQKCDFCAHLLDKGWKEPRCVEACPARALTFGDKEQLSDLIARAEPLHPEYGTSPAVYYIGLPKTFIAGSVFCGATRDCLDSVAVRLTEQETGRQWGASTDNYGEFEFEGLSSASRYSLTIEKTGYQPKQYNDITLTKDLYLGCIYMEKTELAP
jgi:Fe-S-cluster-containing dehydrogenase component